MANFVEDSRIKKFKCERGKTMQYTQPKVQLKKGWETTEKLDKIPHESKIKANLF